jgi:hypothetical protein
MTMFINCGSAANATALNAESARRTIGCRMKYLQQC